MTRPLYHDGTGDGGMAGRGAILVADGNDDALRPPAAVLRLPPIDLPEPRDVAILTLTIT